MCSPFFGNLDFYSELKNHCPGLCVMLLQNKLYLRFFSVAGGYLNNDFKHAIKGLIEQVLTFNIFTFWREKMSRGNCPFPA